MSVDQTSGNVRICQFTQCTHQITCVPFYQCIGIRITLYRCTEIHEHRCTGEIHEHRCTGVAVYLRTGVLVHQYIGVPAYRYTGVPAYRRTGDIRVESEKTFVQRMSVGQTSCDVRVCQLTGIPAYQYSGISV